MIDVDVDGF